ncbi:NAD-dependent epimerase/dehydratase family protein [Saccharothrix longispora]|uniref:NAD-dependent epimerase/dehydratase family protein n=1 Tax=Saccharothrix longispora TaxID=33920 RepID=UPI0028FD985E|nr:NAD-dependent epimerase/dehydratase family protein [Saccharothrix longispora]MDU0293492.1 NAD-dependent epimerase/dehydratase family protein [Saccharothrix longispora]
MAGSTRGSVFVTGGSGFIGHHLVERLRDRGDEVTVFDVAPPQGGGHEGVRYVEGDLRDGAALGRAAQGADMIYHLAAVVGVDQYLARPLDVIDINLSGTRNVLEAARNTGARLVLSSTSEVFGKNPAVPWAEDSDRVLGPTSLDRWSYSSSKALAEHVTFAFARQFGLEATIVRYFNVYGPRQRPAYVVSRSVHRAVNGLSLVVYDEGRQTRCFTYVDDAVEGTIRAGDHDDAVGEVFNIGSMVETTVGEAVRRIAELTGSEVVVQVDTAEKLGASYQDLSRRVPDNAKAGRVLGWHPTTSLHDGLSRTVEWARASSWWLSMPDKGAA